MRTIFARASTIYSGRIDAQLSLGDVVIIIRDVESGGDGSCLVFDAAGGLTPKNWAPAGSTLIETPDSMVFDHVKKEEKLEIFFEHIYWEKDGKSELVGELTKLGAEREVSDLISENLECLEDDDDQGLELVKREFRTFAGPIDLLCRYTAAPYGLLAVEVKRRKVTINDAYQLIRYLEALDLEKHQEDSFHSTPDDPLALGVLVAPSLANNAKEFIKDRPRLRFKRVSYDDLRPPKTEEDLRLEALEKARKAEARKNSRWNR